MKIDAESKRHFVEISLIKYRDSTSLGRLESTRIIFETRVARVKECEMKRSCNPKIHNRPHYSCQVSRLRNFDIEENTSNGPFPLQYTFPRLPKPSLLTNTWKILFLYRNILNCCSSFGKPPNSLFLPISMSKKTGIFQIRN